VRVDLTRPEGKAAIVVSPDAAFMSAGMGTQALSLAEKNAWLDHLHRSFTYIGQHLEDPSITFTAGGTEKIADVQAAVLEIDGAVPSVRWYVDPQSSRVLRENFKTVSESGTFNTDVKLSDWRTVDGLVLPFAIKSKTNRQTTTSECKQIQIYPEIDAKIFEKPANKAKKAKKAAAPSR